MHVLKVVGTVRSCKQETTHKKLSLNVFVSNTPDFKKHFGLPLTILFLSFGSLYFLCFIYFLCGTVRPRKQETTYKKLSLNVFILNTPDYKKHFNLLSTVLFLISGSIYFLCFFIYFLCGTVRLHKQEITHKKLSLNVFVLNTPDCMKHFNLLSTFLFLIFGSLYFLCGTVRPCKQETTYKKLSLNVFVSNTPDYKKHFNLLSTFLFLIFGSIYFLCFFIYFLCGTVRLHKQEITHKKLSLNVFVLNTPDCMKHFNLLSTSWLTVSNQIVKSLSLPCTKFYFFNMVQPIDLIFGKMVDIIEQNIFNRADFLIRS